MSAGRKTADFDHIAVDDVSRHFGRRRAVSRANFRADAGTILGLLSAIGAGIDSLLAKLATLLEPTAGRIRFGPLDRRTHGAALRARIGILGHDLFLYPELTAHENLTFFAGLYQHADAAGAAMRALERAGLADRAHDPVGSFSRGMRQRVALERALIHRPRLALLDEPFTGLDDASAASLLARLKALREEGAIVVLATHDLDLAEGLFDQAIFLRDGKVADSVSQPGRLRATYRDVMGRVAAPRQGSGT